MNANCPRITVITCTYMKFQHVYRTIDSVLNQNYSQIEYLICDDGSNNFPGDDIEAYLKANRKVNLVEYKLLHLPQNVGTVRNLNNGFANSTGKYIIILSAGDLLYDENTVSAIVDVMETNNSDVFSGTRLAVNENGIPQHFKPSRCYSRRLSSLPQRKKYSMFVSGQFYSMFSGSSLAIKKDFFSKVRGFDEKYLLWEDGPFIEKDLRTGGVATRYDMITVKYELGGISSDKTNKRLLDDMDIYNHSDRINHLEELSNFYQKLVKYNIENEGFSFLASIKHPFIMIYKIVYKMKYKIGLFYDRYIIKSMRY